MASVTLTAALRSNLLSLQGTQSLLDQTQYRLATGRKVNSALDNPSAFFAAQALSNRAGDLSSLLDNIGQAVQTLKAADQGIKTLTNFLQQAKSIAQQAKDSALTGGATHTGTYLAGADVADLVGGPGTLAAAGDSFTIQLGSGAVNTISVQNAGDTLEDVAAQINAIEGLSARVVAGTGANIGQSALEITSNNGQAFTIAAGTNNLETSLGLTAGTYNPTGSATVASLQTSFGTVMAQIDNAVADASYRGTNLLDSGNLTVNFNETGSSNLAISGVDFTYGGLNITSLSFSSVANIDSAISEITTALDTVRAQASTFGSNLSIIQERQDFAKSLINTLQEGADKLTIADKNEEGANLLALQTAQQLGITSLSMASQANQAVMRLFG